MERDEEFWSDFPVLSLFRTDIQSNAHLLRYISQASKDDKQAWNKVTGFLKGYAFFTLKTFADEQDILAEDININDRLDNLAGLAFMRHIQDVKLTLKVIQKHLKDEDVTKDNVKNVTCGLLKEERTKRGNHYMFTDKLIETFLSAVFLYNDCLSVLPTKGQLGILSANQKVAIEKLPHTGDIWRVVFGLLGSLEKFTSALIGEIIANSKCLVSMRSYDITSLCIECIYESGDTTLVDYLDDFCVNQTIDFGNVILDPSRLHYTLVSVGNMLRWSTNLYALHLPRFGITGENVTCLVDPLNAVSNNSIEVLELRGNPIGLGGIRQMRRFLVKASRLTHIDFTKCVLTDQGIYILSQCLMCLPLICARLGSNEISDRGVTHLIDGFRKCPSLEYVDLSDNLITDASIEHLVKMFTLLLFLRSVNLQSNYMSEAGIMRFTEAIRKVRQKSRVLKQEYASEGGDNSLREHVFRTSLIRRVNSDKTIVTRRGASRLRRLGGDMRATYSVKIKATGQLSPRAISVSSTNESDEESDEDEKSYYVKTLEHLVQ